MWSRAPREAWTPSGSGMSTEACIGSHGSSYGWILQRHPSSLLMLRMLPYLIRELSWVTLSSSCPLQTQDVPEIYPVYLKPPFPLGSVTGSEMGDEPKPGK